MTERDSEGEFVYDPTLAAVRRHELETEQAKILARELERAEAEGRKPRWPANRELQRERARNLFTPEERNQRAENRHERHRSRAALSGALLRGSDGTSRLTPKELLARQDSLCYLCRTPLTTATTHVEHIIPISRGGKHVDVNLAASCAPCNLRKGSKIVAFYVQSRRPWYAT